MIYKLRIVRMLRLAAIMLLAVMVVSFGALAEPPIHECDRLAAHPDDPHKVGAGVKWGAIDVPLPSELVKEQFRCFPMFQGFKSNTEGLWKMASNIKNPLNGIVSLRSKNMQPPSTVLVRYMKEDLELLTIWPKP